MAEEASAPANRRADRILDAAGELLVRHGYRKVTVEDVAARARIGKGTVYLHWRTKRQLFEALVLRETVAFAEELVAALRADPATVLPHRLLTTCYLVVMRRPVFRALTMEDAPELQPREIDRELRMQELLVVERLFDVMAKRGLFRADVPNLVYAMSASTAGFFLLDRIDPASAELDLPAKADALAYVVRHAFEPAEPPDRETLAAVADEAIAVMEELLPPYLARIYTYDRKQRTP